MDEMNFILARDYSVDIMKWMKMQEKKGLIFKRQSPQLNQRRALVSWLCSVAEKLHLANLTLHLGVKLLDYFMDGHNIQDPQIHLVCLGSLLLAAKMEEKDSNIPKYSQLNVFLDKQVPISDFLSLESMILTVFNFRLNLSTACTFTEMLLPYSILQTDFHEEKAKDGYYEYVKYFLDVVLLEVTFVDTLPSLLAASVILASRVALQLAPDWPEGVETMSGYKKEQLQPYINILLSCFRKKKNEEEVMDEGYHSRNCSPTTKLLDSLNI